MTPPAQLRIDKWLWHARLVKTRSLAERLVEGGHVRRAGVPVARPADAVREGDVVTLDHAGWQRTVVVLGCGTRRGPPAEARMLYRETAAARLTLAEAWTPLLGEEAE